jgi:hypothetical protein
MVQTVGEEVRERLKHVVGGEVKTLQSIVDDLEKLVRHYESRIASRRGEKMVSWASKPLSTFTFPKRIAHRRSDTDTTLVELPDLKLLEPEPAAIPAPAPSTRPHSMAETVSCVCTGLLFGAFITMCIVNSQRRTLIMSLT